MGDEFKSDSDAQPYKTWAEQDDKESRLMMQIGDDKPVCIVRYDRSLVAKADDFTVFQATMEGDLPSDFGSYVGFLMQVNGTPLPDSDTADIVSQH
jgi:hypothetical protein